MLILVSTDHSESTNCSSSRGIQGHWPSSSFVFYIENTETRVFILNLFINSAIHQKKVKHFHLTGNKNTVIIEFWFLDIYKDV